MLKQRQEVGSTFQREPVDFSKLQVGLRKVDDVLINLGTYKKINSNYGNKSFILNAIYTHNYPVLREISNYFYESNGIYYRLCNYAANLYRYDWYVTPFIVDVEKDQKKSLNDFAKVLLYLDKSEIKLLCKEIAKDIIKEGVYYGIIIDFNNKFGIQKLPANYCRNRFSSGTNPVVELNLQFFDAYFPLSPQYKLKILKTFPRDIQLAYIAYKEGKLKGDYPGDTNCWYPLDPNLSVKFNLAGNDFPLFIGTIPYIIDLDEAQELDRQKIMQQLLKVIVQKLPLDKNGDLVFDMDEAKDIHNNAVTMLRRAVGIDVLTTFADIIKIDTKDSNSNTTKDDLERAERTVYNAAGITKNLFNADGNLAVTNSILADESAMSSIPLQFASLLNRILEKFNRTNHYEFRATMLETTQFNYKEMSKAYKEQSQMGFSKILPPLALGQPQSVILATMTFENEVLHLVEKMVPPPTSNTMSGNVSNTSNGNKTNASNNTKETKSVGRPEKEDQQKSDKTIANRESAS